MYMSINEFIVNLIGHTHMALPAMIAAENLIPFTGFLAHNQLRHLFDGSFSKNCTKFYHWFSVPGIFPKTDWKDK